MPLNRIAQIFTFLITLGVGIMSLLVWEPSGKLKPIDSFISPVKAEIFQIGAQIEDNNFSSKSRNRVTREVSPPAHTALDYLICEIDDDPEQVNAFGIYHPADLAITLGNLETQGIKHVFLSTHLHWPERDAEETQTLATALTAFDSAIVSTPLRRNLRAEPITPAFLRASIPVSEVRGNLELLPVVNSLSIPPNVDFPQNTLAGFSELESEKGSSSMPLVARWGDRIVFSAPLLALIQQCKSNLEQVIIYPEKYIRIGNSGNIIPIDAFGHFQPDPTFSPKKPPRVITSALSGESTIIGATQKSAILTATGPKSSKFEAVKDPYLKLSQLTFTPRVAHPKTLKRLLLGLECILIADIALLASWLLRLRRRRQRNFIFILATLVLWLTFFTLYQLFNYWSPLSIYALPLAVGWLLSSLLARPRQTPSSNVSS